MALGASAVCGMRLTAGRETRTGRWRALERAVQIAWAFAGGVALTRGLAETAAGTGHGTAFLFLVAAAICALGVIATAATEFAPSRSVDGR